MTPRKRSKPNPKAETDPKNSTQSQQEQHSQPVVTTDTPPDQSVSPDKPPSEDTNDGESGGTATPRSTSSWYGSWSRGSKAIPITQVAKETISAAGGAASEAVAAGRARTPPLPSSPLRSPAGTLLRNQRTSSRSLPLAATTTKLNITSNASNLSHSTAKKGKKSATAESSPPDHDPIANKSVDEGPGKPGASTAQVDEPNNEGQPATCEAKESEDVQPPTESPGWFAWLSKTEQTEQMMDGGADGPTDPKEKRSDKTVKDRPQSTMPPLAAEAPASPSQRRNSDPIPLSPPAQGEEQPRSWLKLWGTGPTQSKSSSASVADIATSATELPKLPESNDKHSEQDQSKLKASPGVVPQLPEPPKSSGWAFWSKEEPKGDDQKASGSSVGELALAGSPSQSKPEKDVVDESKGIPNKVSKRQSLASAEDAAKPRKNRDGDKRDKKPESVAPISRAKAGTDTLTLQEPKNLVIPSFKGTFQAVAKPSIMQQLTRLLQLTNSPPKHVEFVPNPPQIKKALAIGVHGYFPTPLIRSVLGQPTGTSIRFASSAASAIQKYTQDRGYSCEIETVALEGEGKIAERIELLWNLMLNWINKIQQADFIMIACHSQGVPVTIMLVAKLIAFGYVNAARVGVCAMAGVNLGPFADYKSRWIGGTAGELFDFARPDSQVSKDYETALDTALKFGVRIAYVGSIDDQLVSLDSSTFGTVNHPYIYRAVFINGRVHSPDFLSHLVGFALKLRNLGIRDHGLIRELSSPLAGSLYTGEGHSKIYEEESVYHLAVEHTLGTTFRGNVPMQMQRDVAIPSQNPYILPFAMRGLLEEDYVRTELYGEITELIKQFDDWKPSRQALKDVKFRLEGVRSRL